MAIRPYATLTPDHLDDALAAALRHLDNLDRTILYHRKEHTTDIVLPAALNIARAEGFPLDDIVMTGVAAVFHDCGFERQYSGNETISVAMADAYFTETRLCYSPEHVRLIRDAIQNTDMKSPPKTHIAKALRDADLSILGHGDFLQWNIDLRVESMVHPDSPLYGASQDRTTWSVSQLLFMTEYHGWYTPGAWQLYEEGKQKNILEFREHWSLY